MKYRNCSFRRRWLFLTKPHIIIHICHICQQKMDTYRYISRDEWICNKAERFSRFDTVRVCKLYELVQYTIITIPLAWLSSGAILLFLKPYAQTPDKYTVGQLIFSVFVSIILIVLFAYYIPKLATIVPPLFPYQGTKYIPSMKGESSTATSFAMGIFFFSNMRHLGTVIGNISDRLWPFSFKLKPTN